MPTVAELSAPYGNFMLAPRRGPSVCPMCFDLLGADGRCYSCAHGGPPLDAMAPISYSVAGEQLHHALVSYKRMWGEPARHFELGLAAVLWRHLAGHEPCLARAAGVGADAFAVVTTVPSSWRERSQAHPLQQLVGDLVGPARGRYARVLERSTAPTDPHRFSAAKYTARGTLAGRSVLLIDDTWTTGANARSAAAALKAADAGPVAALVIGRHVNRGWHHNDRQLRSLAQTFDWDRCAVCGEEKSPLATGDSRV
jgi:predicted amidophosphoribosyltransferase